MKDVAKSSLSSIKIKWISTKRKKTRDCLYLKISSRRSHLHPQTTILSSRRLLCALKHNQSDIQVHCSADLQHNTIERLHVNNHWYLFSHGDSYTFWFPSSVEYLLSLYACNFQIRRFSLIVLSSRLSTLFSRHFFQIMLFAFPSKYMSGT